MWWPEHGLRAVGSPTMSVGPLQFLLLVFAGWVNRRQVEVVEYLQEENRILREQLGDRRLRFTDSQRRRLAAKGRAIGRRALEQLAAAGWLFWHDRFAATLGRPVCHREPALGLHPNPRCASQPRSRARTNTIKRILDEHGLAPAPKRGRTMPWRTFLKAHFCVIAATDFFTAEVLTLGGLVRYVVWFVIDLESRRVRGGHARDEAAVRQTESS